MSKKIVRHITTDCCYYTEEDGKTIIICGAELRPEIDGSVWEYVGEVVEDKQKEKIEHKRQYLIDEDTLRELLRAGHILAILERDGVDNWWGWMEGREEYLTDCIGEFPWNEGKTYADLQEIVEEEDYDIDRLVDDEIEAFWEEHKE